MGNEDLFRGQLKAVQEQFDKSISTYDSIIEDAKREQKIIKERKSEGTTFTDREKKEMDYDMKASHYRILSAQKQKEEFLFKMGQFSADNERWDSEEAVYNILLAVYQIASDTLSPQEFNKLQTALNVLKGKTVKELKEHCEISFQ